MDITLEIGGRLGAIIFAAAALLVGVQLLLTWRQHRRNKKAVERLASLGGVETLAHALREHGPTEELLEALGRTKDPRAVGALLEFVERPEVKQDEEKEFVTLGLNALGETGDRRAIDLLVNWIANEKDLFLRDYAACVLGNLATVQGKKVVEAVEPLIALLAEARREQYELVWALEALEAITGKRFGSDPRAWQSWWEREGKLGMGHSGPLG